MNTFVFLGQRHECAQLGRDYCGWCDAHHVHNRFKTTHECAKPTISGDGRFRGTRTCKLHFSGRLLRGEAVLF